MSEYFPKPNSLEANVKIELDLSNYATKTSLKNETKVDKLSFAKKTDLANLKSGVDKIDIDKLKTVPSGLSNLNSKVDKYNVDKLVPVSVDLSNTAKIKNVEDKIPDITNVASNTSRNTKIIEVKGKIPITQLLQLLLLLLKIEYLMLVIQTKKTDYNTKISEIEKKIIDNHHDKLMTTPEFNKLIAEHFAARLAQ